MNNNKNAMGFELEGTMGILVFTVLLLGTTTLGVVIAHKLFPALCGAH